MGNKKKITFHCLESKLCKKKICHLWRFLIPLLLNIQIFFLKIYILRVETVIYNRKGKEEEDLVITKHHSTPF